ncbi:MAG TPA: methylenetetrahydrofolate--tRNA-(uracil(54)-C(5))-methyltransferase (FADH(2)-oxidizing) TrmFO [Smithellaceae bacterium]|nr:methylenetetrahydrofolate--tRNA-(uracil(54)-C(5))-methyltransferase (FADH(2)-oxidizing) TrmFO [Smithellaceae bacterium]HRS89696.1 methylenetetrahydrofolate--tRNA-(uracil(54)-C(5))-methyltransferase (FADH(2)-oxidizing) TrmFO [Smithellaceae bacterium]HRV27014.1 methylenetetrahydrofolate--tRNA-(uracil(54)-C(5))-methyltransferase (FADH(2)-oxidizing) TrmFO [Smithellaceae bacterium]
MAEKKRVIIIGGGLAGCEAAWQLLRRGHRVFLHEMRPEKFTPAHKTEFLAELVCSNSLKSNSIQSAPGLLKEEMRCLHSLILTAAQEAKVDAGTALAVDRLRFSRKVEEMLNAQDNFTLIRKECAEIPEDCLTIIATGPLTSESFAVSIAGLLGSSYLYFYDAIAPIIEADSIKMEKAFWASRYNKSTPDYLNLPLSEEEYKIFCEQLLFGEKVPPKPFEEVRHFEGCLPIETLAARGEKTMVFGPLKPVGLPHPKTGKTPYAVVQLRRENSFGTLFNMVGFQTKLTWPEQRRIFRLIPGLEEAQFARYGSIHRNTYINAPAHLRKSLQLNIKPTVLFAGQIIGVEGYVESAAMGLLAGLNAAFILEEKELQPPPPVTCLGALINYITSPPLNSFQPMNINYGLLDPLGKNKIRKKDKKALYAKRSLESLRQWMSDYCID